MATGAIRMTGNFAPGRAARSQFSTVTESCHRQSPCRPIRTRPVTAVEGAMRSTGHQLRPAVPFRTTPSVHPPTGRGSVASRLCSAPSAPPPSPPPAEPSGLVGAFLCAQNSISYYCTLLADDAGKNPDNPLWLVGAAKLSLFLGLYLLFKIVQPQLDKWVEKLEAKQAAQQQLSADGMLNTMEEARTKNNGYWLALVKALQSSTKRLVPIMIALVFVSNLSDYIEDILYVNQDIVTGFAAEALRTVGGWLTMVDNILERATSLLGVAVGVQFFIKLKDQVVSEFMRTRASAGLVADRGLSQSIVSLSQAASFVIYAIGAVMGLAVIGIDIRPLAAVGGIGGLAVGLGAQQVVSSLLAGVQLLVSNPFQAGDVVELSSGGTTVMLGKVEQVSPFRCVFVSLTDKKVPWTIPNSDIVGMNISNRSRIHQQEAGTLLDSFKETRKLHMKLSVSLDEEKTVADVIPVVADGLRSKLDDLDATAPGTPITVEWQGLRGSEATFDVVTFFDTIPGEYESAKTLALCDIDRVLLSNNCKLASVETLA